MAKPVLPISASSFLPTMAASSSRWNHKTVTLMLGLTALVFFLYKLFSRSISATSTSTEKNPPLLVTVNPKVQLAQGSLVPFTTGLFYEGKPCINELAKPTFEKYASGVIRLDLNSFGSRDLEQDKPFTIECKDHAGAVFFKACAIACGGNPDFFIANLPFGKEITVEFGQSTRKNIKLNIGQTAGLYTIRENDADEGLNYESASLGSSKVLTAHLRSNLPALKLSFTLDVVTTKLKLDNPSKNSIEPVTLTILNKDKLSIIYLLLVSNNSALSVEERAFALPLIINGQKKNVFPLSLLEYFWLSQYKHVTGKDKPDGDLQLSLGGYQQIVYSGTGEHM